MENEKLYKYLCDSDEEIEECKSICNIYENEYDRLTEYRKSRINRNVGQVTAKEIKDLIEDKAILKELLQRMFGDFIENLDINEFIKKVEQGLDIQKLINLHNKYSLEKFSNLLIVI